MVIVSSFIVYCLQIVSSFLLMNQSSQWQKASGIITEMVVVGSDLGSDTSLSELDTCSPPFYLFCRVRVLSGRGRDDLMLTYGDDCIQYVFVSCGVYVCMPSCVLA